MIHAPSTIAESSGIAETQSDLEILYKEYNDLCDRCDALDAKKLVIVAAHDAAEVSLKLIYANTEKARVALLDLQREAIAYEDRCLSLQDDERTHVLGADLRREEIQTHRLERQELQNAVQKLEADLARVSDTKTRMQSEVGALEATLKENARRHAESQLHSEDAAKAIDTTAATFELDTVLQHQRQENDRLLRESRVQLETVRAKVTECNAEYTVATERLRVQSADKEATRLQDERISNKQRAAREQQLSDFTKAVLELEAVLATMEDQTLHVLQSHDEHQAALLEIIAAYESRKSNQQAEEADMQRQLDTMSQHLSMQSFALTDKQNELAELNATPQPTVEAVVSVTASNDHDEDDAFETMLKSISEDTVVSQSAKRETIQLKTQQLTLQAEVVTLQEQCDATRKRYEEMQAQARIVGQQTEVATAKLSQTREDLKVSAEQLVTRREQQSALLDAHKKEQEFAGMSPLEQGHLLQETRSSLGFMEENKQELLRNIDTLRTQRDDHARKLEQIHCYGNTLNTAMTELRGTMHLRQSSPDFQIKIETVLDLFANFLDWFEGTFTVPLYEFTCVLQNSRIE